MTANRLLFPFAEGLLLEDRHVLIPWGTSFSQLGAFGSPEMHSAPDCIRFVWNDASILGGLTGQVLALRLLDAMDPLAYHLHLPEFYGFMVLIFRDPNESSSELSRLLRGVYQHLADQIGAATFSHPDYLDGLPSFHWKAEPFEVSCIPAGWNVVAVSVNRTPEGYAAVRGAAERLRTPRDARVPFVAGRKTTRDFGRELGSG